MVDSPVLTKSSDLPDADNLRIGFKKEIILDQNSRDLIESYCKLPSDKVESHLYAVVGHSLCIPSCVLHQTHRQLAGKSMESLSMAFHWHVVIFCSHDQ